MLEQGHIIDPDSQQVRADLGVVTKLLQAACSSLQVVGMIRPMSGDFEFFDPIPLQAACSVWGGDKWQAVEVTVLFCKLVWHFGKCRWRISWWSGAFAWKLPLPNWRTRRSCAGAQGEGSWAMRVVQQFREWSQFVNFVEILKSNEVFWMSENFATRGTCMSNHLKEFQIIWTEIGIPKGKKNKLSLDLRQILPEVRGREMDGMLMVACVCKRQLWLEWSHRWVQQGGARRGQSCLGLGCSYERRVEPMTCATQSPEWHLKAGWYVVQAIEVLKYRLENWHQVTTACHFKKPLQKPVGGRNFICTCRQLVLPKRPPVLLVHHANDRSCHIHLTHLTPNTFKADTI